MMQTLKRWNNKLLDKTKKKFAKTERYRVRGIIYDFCESTVNVLKKTEVVPPPGYTKCFLLSNTAKTIYYR